MTEEIKQTEQVETEAEVAVEEASASLTESEIFGRLTKRNQQYMLTLDRNLAAANLTESIRQQIYQEMCETLEEGQQTGQTARQLYGTPTECTAVILEQQFPSDDEGERSADWKIALDGGLLLGSVFTLITGFSLMRQGEHSEATINNMGLITLIVNYLVAGSAMLIVSKVLPDMDAPKGKRGYFKYFSVSSLAMLGWIVAVSISSVIFPTAINPVFPYDIYFIIGGLTFLLRFYLKKRWNIKGGLF